MLLQNMGHVSAKQHSAQCVAFHPQTQRRVRRVSAVYKASRVQSPKWKGCSRLQSGLICASATPENGSASTSDAGSVLDCVIVGGGISGLCTALAFKAEHGSTVKKFLLTEGRERVGGNITTVSNDEGYLWEEGPNSFQPSDAVLKAAVDAGVDSELVLGDPTAPRFVFWNDKLRATPSGLDAVTFDLLSIWGKLRAGLGAIGLRPSMPDYEESVEEFIRRNLGEEVFERLIEPFCSGVYAGDPAKLSMKAAFGKIYDVEKLGGSLVGGSIKLIQKNKANPPPPRDPRLPPKPAGQTVGSFKRGLVTLTDGIAATVGEQIRTKWVLKEILKQQDGLFALLYDTPNGAVELKARSVALTIPAYVAAGLLQAASPDAADALRDFDYPPVAAVTLAYPLSAIREDRKGADGKLPGFGQLHPRSQGVVTLGTIYSSSLFPNRAPEGFQLLLNYIGGAKNRGITDQATEEIVAQVDKDLRKMLLKPDAPGPKTVGVRVWPKAIPQFNVGHLEILQGAKDDLAEVGYEGVFLGGNYAAGVALGKCIEYAYVFAKDVSKYVENQPTASKSAVKTAEEVFV